MNIAKKLEQLMGMDDATWSKHSNPWSGWTRMTILPLLSLAIWSHVWLGWGALWAILAVVIWTWVNPRLFPAPIKQDAWMTKGVLGERVWLSKSERPIPAYHVRVCNVLNLTAVIGLFALAYGLWQLDLGWTIAGLITTLGAKLWFLDRMVWILTDVARPTTQIKL